MDSRLPVIKRYWVPVILATVVSCTFLFNESLRNAIKRYRRIQKSEVQLRSVQTDIETVRQKIRRLESQPYAFEQLVRKELGYLRPGEKEIRFVKKNDTKGKG